MTEAPRTAAEESKVLQSQQECSAREISVNERRFVARCDGRSRLRGERRRSKTRAGECATDAEAGAGSGERNTQKRPTNAETTCLLIVDTSAQLPAQQETKLTGEHKRTIKKRVFTNVLLRTGSSLLISSQLSSWLCANECMKVLLPAFYRKRKI